MSVNWPGKPVSWNPVIGCGGDGLPCEARCWAKGCARKFPLLHGVKAWDGKVEFRESILDKPLHRRKPTVYAVCLMGDLFHWNVPEIWQVRVNRTMKDTPQHTFVLCTKRAHVMQSYYSRPTLFGILPNVWLGVTVCNQAEADERIPLLLATPAAHKWVSYEPALGPLNLLGKQVRPAAPDGRPLWPCSEPMLFGLDAVIAGCESGPARRYCASDWLNDVAAQCETMNVPCFIKQRNVNGKMVHCPSPADWPWIREVRNA